jgi:hypothetical protein
MKTSCKLTYVSEMTDVEDKTSRVIHEMRWKLIRVKKNGDSNNCQSRATKKLTQNAGASQ